MLDAVAIQSAMKSAGKYAGRIDGDFGPLSRSARDTALKEAGVDIAGWPHSRRMIAIRQWVLKGAGFDPGPIDGVEGPKTIAATSAYLHKNAAHSLGHAGEALIQSFEQFRAHAYPDPGSKDGKPVTIGWGSTRDADGNPIKLGTIWTRGEADEQFRLDIAGAVADVAKAIGASPTTAAQFDALVSFHYNTGAIAKATLTKLHKAGEYEAAALEFAKWNKNDGKVLAGLTRRRAAEAALYRSGIIAKTLAGDVKASTNEA